MCYQLRRSVRLLKEENRPPVADLPLHFVLGQTVRRRRGYYLGQRHVARGGEKEPNDLRAPIRIGPVSHIDQMPVGTERRRDPVPS